MIFLAPDTVRRKKKKITNLYGYMRSTARDMDDTATAGSDVG